MIKYGVDWGEIPEASIELTCYRYPQKVLDAGGRVYSKFFHFKKAVQLLFCQGPDAPLKWNPWTDLLCKAFCEDRFFVVWGPAASSKSNSIGCFVLTDWLAAPKDTCTFVCSTTKAMLEKRIWESVKRYHNYLRQNGTVPGKLSKSRCAIINEDEDDSHDIKAGIHGIAVLQGTVEEAKSNIIGVHLPHVRLVIDEMQATRRAAIEARSNLSKGCEDFKFIGLANPMSLLDLSGEFSEPIDGWDTITPDTGEWETRWGKCYHLDGFKSPAITEEGGKQKYPFLINQEQIDADIQDHGDEPDHPDIWTFCRGFPPPQGNRVTVLTESFIVKFKMRGQAVWQYDYVTVAGLDPAFTAGGDKCVLQVAKVGLVTTGELVIEFQDPHYIEIKATDTRPPIYQIVDEVKTFGAMYGFQPGDLCVDESGVQSVGDVIDVEWSPGCYKLQFNSKASDRSISNSNLKHACDIYRNKVTEMWYQMAEFGRRGQIRGLGFNACKQFVDRQVETRNALRKLESKVDMKKRSQHSPDEADACACVLAMVRDRLGYIPGIMESPVEMHQTKERVRRRKDKDFYSNNKYGSGSFRSGYGVEKQGGSGWQRLTISKPQR